MWEKLEAIARRYEALTAEMARPEVAADYQRFIELDRERASIEQIVQLHRQHGAISKQLEDARSLFEETTDPEMKELAREELEGLTEQRERLEERIRLELLPKDPRDDKNVILEIRAGTGGDEAALFAADLFRMYTRYAERHGWAVEVLSASENSDGGFKEVIAEVRGRGAYSRLKYESGVHRVQRVPVTEAQGRIHTSAATVAVLPEAEEVDVDVADRDLRIDIFHSGGAGGQNVNKVATAVRLTHIPTGLVVVCQDERSQHKNRDKAMKVLKTRLLDLEMSKQSSEISEARRSQVGSGDRSERIRTYNFPQDRITDHRIGLTVHNLPARLDGELDDIIDALIADDRAKALAGTA
jgi:peptide chain release factor 1